MWIDPYIVQETILWILDTRYWIKCVLTHRESRSSLVKGTLRTYQLQISNYRLQIQGPSTHFVRSG